MSDAFFAPADHLSKKICALQGKVWQLTQSSRWFSRTRAWCVFWIFVSFLTSLFLAIFSAAAKVDGAVTQLPAMVLYFLFWLQSISMFIFWMPILAFFFLGLGKMHINSLLKQEEVLLKNAEMIFAFRLSFLKQTEKDFRNMR